MGLGKVEGLLKEYKVLVRGVEGLLEERRGRAVLECIARRRIRNGGYKTRNPDEISDEKREEKEAAREAVGEEEDQAVDEEVRERFRDEIRRDWSAPSKARALKSASHIMSWGGGDVREGYTRPIGGALATSSGRRGARRHRVRPRCELAHSAVGCGHRHTLRAHVDAHHARLHLYPAADAHPLHTGQCA